MPQDINMPPNFRKTKHCMVCAYVLKQGGHEIGTCSLYSVLVDGDITCDEWEEEQ